MMCIIKHTIITEKVTTMHTIKHGKYTVIDFNPNINARCVPEELHMY